MSMRRKRPGVRFGRRSQKPVGARGAVAARGFCNLGRGWRTPGKSWPAGQGRRPAGSGHPKSRPAAQRRLQPGFRPDPERWQQSAADQQHPQKLVKCKIGPDWQTFGQFDQYTHGMIDSGNGLTSWLKVFEQKQAYHVWGPIAPLIR